MDGLIVSEIFPPIIGGSGNWLWEIFKRQSENSYTILTQKCEGSERIDQGYTQNVCREALNISNRAILNTKGATGYWRLSRQIMRSIRAHSPKLMIGARPLSEGLACYFSSKLSGIPYILFVHGEDINVARTSRELSFMTSHTLKNAKAIVANSNFTRNLLTDDWGMSDTKIATMNPGVDCEKFNNKEINRPHDDCLRLFTAGRLQKRKGHDTVISAIPKLLNSFKDVQYIIAGCGEEEPYLRGIIDQHGVHEHVELVGEVSEVELLRLYQECDIFVLANREVDRDVEGFGIVLLEAQAMGKPVIAGRSGGTSDTLLEGRTGFLMTPGSGSDLIKIIQTRLNTEEKRTQIGMAARKHVRTTFDWKVLSQDANRIIQSLM